MRQKDSQRDLETESERLKNKETERLRDSQRDLEIVRET